MFFVDAVAHIDLYPAIAGFPTTALGIDEVEPEPIVLGRDVHHDIHHDKESNERSENRLTTHATNCPSPAPSVSMPTSEPRAVRPGTIP
jgi:hypothetical protein